MKAWLMLIVWLVMVVSPGVLLAEPQALSAQETRGDDEDEEWIDEAHEEVIHSLRGASQWLDSFFDDDRFVAEENRTRARLKLGLRYTEGDGFDLEPRLNLRLHLPKLSKNVSLLLFAADDDKPEIGAYRTDPSFGGESVREAGAALQYFLKETKKYNISFTAGGSTGYLYGGGRYRIALDLDDDWQARFMAQLRYYTDDGLKNLNILDLDRPLSEMWLFRTTLQLEWLEEDDQLPFAAAFRLYQTLDQDRILSYEWENRMEEVEKGEITEVMLLFRYRERFLREWLFWEVSPRVTFPEEQDWDPEYALLFKVDVNFGF